ncbi:MAG: hypothetical protein QNI84_10625 [Henriciella sp.]|nr:hypothetical protein [Henriciella sp.]
MSSIVPASGHGLIFQPTEALSARVISAEDERDEAHKKLDAAHAAIDREKRKRVGANLLSMLLFGMALAACAAAFFLWSGTQGQVAKADMERDAAFEERDLARQTLQSEQDRSARQLAEIQAFDEYRNVADLTYEIRRMEVELDNYRTQLENKPTPGLDRDATLNVETTARNWLVAAQEELNADKTRLEDALTELENWTLVRDEPVRPVTCLPQNPLRPRPVPEGC